MGRRLPAVGLARRQPVATRGALGGQTPIVQRTARSLFALVLACLATGIGLAASGRSEGARTADVGALATFLARGDAERVARLVAPADQSALPASRLAAAWQVAAAGAGPFRRVVRTITVDEGRIHHELEVLSFANGTGTLSAWRTSEGITALWLVAGAPFDANEAALAGGYAKDLVNGDFTTLRAAFDQTMASALPQDQLASETHDDISALTPGASIVAQVTVPRPADTTVVTYLLFKNGLRRLDITFDARQQIAGMFIHNI